MTTVDDAFDGNSPDRDRPPIGAGQSLPAPAPVDRATSRPRVAANTPRPPLAAIGVTLAHDTGWWTARSRDLPDLYVANSDIDVLAADVAATVRVLLLADLGVDCTIDMPDLRSLTRGGHDCSIRLPVRRAPG